MEAQGETEFLTKLLCIYAATEQQKHSRTLQLIEENIRTLSRAIQRMLWFMCIGAALLWANSVVAEWIPPGLVVFGAKVAGCWLIASGISFLAFFCYRALVQRKLERYRQHCRELLEAAVEWQSVSDATVRLREFAPKELHCARCRRELTGPEIAKQIGTGRGGMRRQIVGGVLSHSKQTN